jgi:hypothetical protein
MLMGRSVVWKFIEHNCYLLAEGGFFDTDLEEAERSSRRS